MAVLIKKGESPSEKIKQGHYTKHFGAPEAMKYSQVSGQVTMQKKLVGQTSHEGTSTEVVHPGLASGPDMCRVSVSGSRTLNLGNFESVKISVSLDMPCPKSEIESTYEYVTDWVGQKLADAVSTQKG